MKGLKQDFRNNRSLYLLSVIGVAFYLVFQYLPMWGVVIAFQDFSPVRGVLASPWVGFTHFVDFFNSYYFSRVLSNTLILSGLDIMVGFPIPIILALLINEVFNGPFRRTVQTLMYLPHFISLVVVCGLIVDFTARDGLINSVLASFGWGASENLLMNPDLFRPIYILSGIWQQAGWNSIVYLAALAAIDPALYEAAEIDGATRWRKVVSVTLPSIMPIVVMMLILRIGSVMSIGFEKIILLYSPVTYSSADVISSFVYRKGLLENDFSFASAVGLFNSVVNLLFLLGANAINKKVNNASIF